MNFCNEMVATETCIRWPVTCMHSCFNNFRCNQTSDNIWKSDLPPQDNEEQGYYIKYFIW